MKGFRSMIDKDVEEDILFFSNGRGGVALSVDAGETVMIANGRTLDPRKTVWEETGEDVEDQLSDLQQAYLRDARSVVLSDVERLIRQHRRQRLAESHLYIPEKVRVHVPEDALVVKSAFDD